MQDEQSVNISEPVPESVYNSTMEKLKVHRELCKILKTNNPLTAVRKLVSQLDVLKGEFSFYERKEYKDGDKVVVMFNDRPTPGVFRSLHPLDPNIGFVAFNIEDEVGEAVPIRNVRHHEVQIIESDE